MKAILNIFILLLYFVSFIKSDTDSKTGIPVYGMDYYKLSWFPFIYIQNGPYSIGTSEHRIFKSMVLLAKDISKYLLIHTVNTKLLHMIFMAQPRALKHDSAPDKMG